MEEWLFPISQLDLGMFLVLALLIESVVEVIKWVYKGDPKELKDRIIAMVVAVVVAVFANFDVFVKVGIDLKVPFAGAALTGILMARGANVFHDIIKVIMGISTRVSSK